MQVEETTPSTPLRPTRASFVRGLPLEMPVEEVIERGREAGIELQPSDIHAARYYMRQVAAADGSSIPQQLLLGGTFVTKREPRGAAGKSANGAAKTNGAASADGEQLALGSHAPASSATGSTARKAPILRDADDEYEDDVEPVVAPTRRIVQPAHITQPPQLPQLSQLPKVSKAEAAREAKRQLKEAKEAKREAERAAAAAAKTKGANGLHSRLQARLQHVTFRDTAREERDAVKAKARDEKATIGKALSDLDNALKPRNKRGVQTAEALEEQLRLIALRVGTQRVREVLDAMEELAKRA